MKRFFVLHPFLVAAYPILALFASNVDQVQFREVYRALLIALAGLAGLLLALRHIVKDWDRSGLLCSLIFILFFSYGHISLLVSGVSLGGIPIGRPDYLLALWAVILVVGAWWLLRRLGDPRRINRFLNIVAVVIVILPSYRLTSFALESALGAVASSFHHTTPGDATKLAVPEQLPDIYYVIVDGYARGDVLEEIYSYDNSDFLRHLMDRGFYIASNSHSNYGQTRLSLSSSLNYRYIEALSGHGQVVDLIKNSRVRAFLRDIGYQTVALASGFSFTEIEDADLYSLRFGP